MKSGQPQAMGARNTRLLDQIAHAQSRLYNRLIALDIASVPISEYNQRYLGTKLASLKGALHLYGELLYLSMHDSPIPPDAFVLVDYGGGSGLISLLAAELGIGTVVYNDIYDVSCADVGRLSHALGLTLDHIVCGDADDLVSYLHGNAITAHAITSYDVLEHIHDVASHFRTLRYLSNSTLRIVYASGANPGNPRYVRSAKQLQLAAEYRNRTRQWGHKERDSLQAFLDVRRNMIAAYAPDLAREAAELLARSTRGLMRREIEECVDEYRRHGRITYHIDHPTNTCDPYTGNWCEHLLDFEWLERVLTKEGYSVEIVPGRYIPYGSLLKRSVKRVLNAAMQRLGRRGMFIAPYYVVRADLAERGAAVDGDAAARSAHP